MTTNTKKMRKRKTSLIMRLSNKRSLNHNLNSLSNKKEKMTTMRMMGLKIRIRTEQELARINQSPQSNKA